MKRIIVFAFLLCLSVIQVQAQDPHTIHVSDGENIDITREGIFIDGDLVETTFVYGNPNGPQLEVRSSVTMGSTTVGQTIVTIKNAKKKVILVTKDQSGTFESDLSRYINAKPMIINERDLVDQTFGLSYVIAIKVDDVIFEYVSEAVWTVKK